MIILSRLESNPHINEFIRYTVHKEKITIIFKAAGNYSVDFRIYGRSDFGLNTTSFSVERFRRSGQAIVNIGTFDAFRENRKYSLDNVGREDFITIICKNLARETLIGSSLTLYSNYNIS